MMPITTRLLALACLSFASISLAARPSASPLAILSTTPLPDVTGGDFDHFAVDLAHSRLYVSAEKYGSIEVFGLPDGQHLASVKTVARAPHKIVLANDGKELLIADAGDANVKVVDTKTFKVKKVVPLEPQPDSGIADRQSGIFYVGNGGVQSHKGSAYISLISLADDSVVGRIDVPAGQLKAMVIDRSTHRLFVNMREKNEIGVIDLNTRKLTSIWHVPGPSLNSAMAFDPKTRRLFIGSRKPGKLFVMDASNGSVIQSLYIVDISDDMTFDALRHRLYVTGAGGLDVVKQVDSNHYAIEQHIDTLGGKTSIYIPSLQRLYVVHTKGPQASEAGLQVLSVG
ncbi:YncE family protein [Paraburkholderia aspalathi]|uniref:YncE family protein n=1 Tax=Paraburkholderia aspalathi TaxID=1324617 RepID=UPI0038BDC086